MKKLITILSLVSCSIIFGQDNSGNISGNVATTFQYLNSDTLIGANQPPEKALLNTYANIFYTNKGFKAGARIESYLPRIQGYPDRFSGTGIGMRYAGYENDFIDVTLGSFYEQFGSGMLFRAYENRGLGYDNVMDGLRLKVKPYKGIELKGVYGKQRFRFIDGKVEKSDGIVRGFDGEIHLNETFDKLKNSKLDVILGGSMVSKFQKDDRDDLILPENVFAYGGRMALRYGKFYLNGEYNIKQNDPSSDNRYIYNKGYATQFNLGYSTRGLGILLTAKSFDNMSFRSDRNKDLQDVLINFMPNTNKTHTYNLVATLYPYATQLSGEVAFQGDIIYTIPKKSKIGGKYGMPISVNFSTIYQPERTANPTFPLSSSVPGYTSDSTLIAYSTTPFQISKTQYWHDFNIQIKRKFNKKFYTKLAYYNLMINNDVIKVTNNAKGNIFAQIGVIELGYRINRKHSLRAEIQGLVVGNDSEGHPKDKGNWATALIEYNISPNWFVSIMDQYNYGNKDVDKRTHYIVGSCGYTKGASRIMATYGRQRAGLFCVGGVCRFVPASNGLTLTFTQSF